MNPLIRKQKEMFCYVSYFNDNSDSGTGCNAYRTCVPWNRSIFEKKLRIETAFAWSLFFVSKSPIKINHKYHI